MPTHENSDVMTPDQVARMFNVTPKTVSRWAKEGKIKSIRTPGGHRRFHRREIMAVYNGDTDASTS